MDEMTKRPEIVEALARGLAVLEAFNEGGADMSITEVAQRAGLTPATARRILRTLEMLEYVGSANKRYHLRPRVLSLGSAFLRSMNIDEAFTPELRNIVKQFGDAASVGVIRDRDVFYIAHSAEPKGMRPVAGVGVSLPLHATSLGKVLLAGLSPLQLDRFFAAGPLTTFTPSTISEETTLRQELARVREQGYATCRDELTYGVTALAVPVHITGKGSLAALNTSGYSGHVTPETLVAERLEMLRHTASNIAHILMRSPTLCNALLAPAGMALF